VNRPEVGLNLVPGLCMTNDSFYPFIFVVVSQMAGDTCTYLSEGYTRQFLSLLCAPIKGHTGVSIYYIFCIDLIHLHLLLFLALVQ
jgi:hypothetical protein